MADVFKPNLAWTVNDVSEIQFPVLVSKKLDGIRCISFEGVAYSRTMKPLPNKFIQKFFSENADVLDGLDGEIIVGEPNAHDVLNKTTSGIMSQDGEPDFTFFVFDVVDVPLKAKDRLEDLGEWSTRDPFKSVFDKVKDRVKFVQNKIVKTPEELLRIESEYLEEGYEGVMIRGLNSMYKQGRSTKREQGLGKLKRFVDAEFKVLGFEPMMQNNNEATLDAFGNTKRSSHKENLQELDTLGKIVLEYEDGKTFGVGTFKGWDANYRKQVWDNRENLIGKMLKIKYFPVGNLNVPRLPVGLAFRDEIDM